MLAEYDVNDRKKEHQIIEDDFEKNLEKFESNCSELRLVKAKKHNLPDATIVINVTQSLETLWMQVGRNHKDKINKAKKAVLNSVFSIQYSALHEDAEKFYELYA